jgi:hypothetical protein
MKIFTSRKSVYILTGLILLALLIGIVGYLKQDSIQRRYYGYQARHELSQQIEPLLPSLNAIGFTNLSKTKVSCTSTPDAKSGKNINSCVAITKEYIVVGNDSTVVSKLTGSAKQFSEQLDKNGWKQRKDYPVIAWFTALGKGVDYQPDQLNIKQLDSMTCTIDITTAFSKPAPPAISLVATCEKPAIPGDLLAPNF